MSSKTRPRDDGDRKSGPATAAAAAPAATIGQQTSHIKNKLVRSETYAKLKHKKKVRGLALTTSRQVTTANLCCKQQLCRMCALVVTPPQLWATLAACSREATAAAGRLSTAPVSVPHPVRAAAPAPCPFHTAPTLCPHRSRRSRSARRGMQQRPRQRSSGWRHHHASSSG